jgi:hypothetical protein
MKLNWLYLVVGMGMAGLAGVIVLVYSFFGCLPVSGSNLAKLKEGMSTNEVLAILGPPNQTFVGSKPGTNDIVIPLPGHVSSNEMQLLLAGPPPGKNFVSSACITWIYGSYFHLQDVEVFFDCDGRYLYHWSN